MDGPAGAAWRKPASACAPSPSGAGGHSGDLPDGRILILNRGVGLPYGFYSILTVIERGAIRPGAVVRGRAIARLEAPYQPHPVMGF